MLIKFNGSPVPRMMVHFMIGFGLVIFPLKALTDAREGVSSSTVMQLLDLEAKLAVKNLEGLLHQRSEVDQKQSEGDRPDRLFSIYGVGSVLTAELMVDSKYFVFRSGNRKPVFGQSENYELRSIEPPCVKVSLKENEKILCAQVEFP